MNYVDDNPHRVCTDYSERVHYKRHTACGVNDEPDRIELKPRWANYPTIDFEWPRQRYKLEKIERLMAWAYERGKIDHRAEVGRMFRELMGP